jgi:four helix bundle protein
MFSFEKFPVYKRSEELVKKLQPVLNSKKINLRMKDQLYRASSSICLNIAEGSGKYSKRDKKNYYTFARGSAQECVAVLRILKVEGHLDKSLYEELYDELEVISMMLSGLIRKMLGET